MITKERLEEMLNNNEPIYGINSDNELCTFYGRDIEEIFEDIGDTINLYETKEEAEFVAKNHDKEVLEFKPPFKFGEYYYYHFISKKYGEIQIVCIINIAGKCKYLVYSSNSVIKKDFNTYQEALDYARKLFKEEV